MILTTEIRRLAARLFYGHSRVAVDLNAARDAILLEDGERAIELLTEAGEAIAAEIRALEVLLAAVSEGGGNGPGA